MLLTCTNLPPVSKTFVLSILECRLGQDLRYFVSFRSEERHSGTVWVNQLWCPEEENERR